MPSARRLTIAQRFEMAGARAIGALAPSVKRRIAGQPIRLDGLELDLDTQVLLKLEERNPRGPLTGRTPAEAREDLRHAVRVVAGAQIPLASVLETSVAGADGPLAARLYVPDGGEAAGPAPLVVYYHGGGWVAGDLDTHDQPCRLLARTSGARVLSVDYRLSPEHPFPAPVDDALAAFRDVSARAAEYGADPARIAVAGDSAGGHLAAVTCQQAMGDGGPVPAFQLLIYPATDFVNVAQSRLTFAEGFLLTKANMDWYELQFFGPDGDRRDPRASPLQADDLSGSPPALIVTAGFDPLRDEGEAYARKLSAAGVRTLLRRHDGYVHGFMHVFISGPGPREAIAEMGGVLRSALAG
ncbi:MAG TPA: alpha/beta hydrolase [Solirubrobacteraceae bacterium]|jgi:acetyl esterase|nr:alpha/beta hydrolase [Solirubrobacteraceae bacterium]